MEFIRCPQCGEFDEKRTRCRCGYSAVAAASAKRPPSPGFLAVLARLVGGWVRAILLLISAGLIFMGGDDYKVGQGATEQPQDLDLAKLEAGQMPTQNHIRIGKHIRLYPHLIYVISKHDKDNPDPHLWHTFYPIISLSHPDRPNNVKDAEAAALPFQSFAVLVKTNVFRRLADVPPGIATEDSIQGMVVNSIRELSSDEAKLIKDSFPNMDTAKIIILEQGRTPSSAGRSLAMMGGGILLAILVIGLYFVGRASHTGSSDD